SASDELLEEIEPIITLGIHHEQQHQELLVTDIKHVFAQNPLYPVFRKRTEKKRQAPPPTRFIDFDGAVGSARYRCNRFSYDNEGPQHRALVPKFFLGSRLVTCGEYQQFIDSCGYTAPAFLASPGRI